MDVLTTIIITIASGLIGGFISYYFAEKTENYKFELLRREQAAKIATLLAKWGKYSAKETAILNKKELYDYYEELTRLSYELSLWISDETLVKKVMARLQNRLDAPKTKEVLIEIREHILGKKAKNLKAEEIIHWCFKE